jgi:hypothetical protein
VIKSRKFTFEDQDIFAMLSGDYNPLHMDRVAARRFIFGQPVAHGLHVLLWALDCLLEDQQKFVKLRSLKAVFKKPIPLDEEIECFVSYQGDNSVKIDVLTKGSIVVNLRLAWDVSGPGSAAEVLDRDPDSRHCNVLTIDKIINASGKIDLCINKEAVSKIFPNLIKNMQLTQVQEILAASRLIGMECPGYHSLLSTLDVSFVNDPSRPTTLNYTVANYDERFSLIDIKVKGPSIDGDIGVFFRPPPRKQESFLNLRRTIKEKEFAGQNALIIGGSRGLGEVTAKLLAAGAANVTITFHRSKEDACRIVEEIVSGKGLIDCMHFDVLNIGKNLEKEFNNKIKPTHLYYFATPFIFVRGKFMPDKERFSVKLFQDFCGYYIDGFAATVEKLLSLSPKLKNIFYPSSVAIDEPIPSLVEYACAKASGEVFCASLEKRHKGLFIYRPRLPRLATDQTVSLLPDGAKACAPLILKHLRIFKKRDSKK